jgi:phosphate butyryltransferase
VAVAGAEDESVLGAVAAGIEGGVMFHLVGNPGRIRDLARREGVSIDSASIVEPDEDDEASVCGKAVSLCVERKASVLMKGLVGTAAFTRAILDKAAGLTPASALLSHTGLFSDPRNGRVFLLTDAAINISPDVEVKKKILANAVSVARFLGISFPRIALLAPVEKVSQRIQSTLDAAELKKWVNGGALGEAVADGPFALDVAASSEAAEVKGISSEVAGRTDIYLAPSLDAGNIFYKAMTVFAGASAAGILAGARVPVVLTSRSDSEKVKIASLGFALRLAAAAQRTW